MAEPKNVVEFIPRAEYENLTVLSEVANRPGEGQINLPKELNRRRVVSAFMDAFELIGGTTRLAEWANDPDNQTDFYKLYARLMPSAPAGTMEDNTVRTIRHVLPPTKLDD